MLLRLRGSHRTALGFVQVHRRFKESKKENGSVRRVQTTEDGKRSKSTNPAKDSLCVCWIMKSHSRRTEATEPEVEVVSEFGIGRRKPGSKPRARRKERGEGASRERVREEVLITVSIHLIDRLIRRSKNEWTRQAVRQTGRKVSKSAGMQLHQ